MHAIPLWTPRSCTASISSSVMSRTVRPPFVRRCVSRWNTFTGPTLLVDGPVSAPIVTVPQVGVKAPGAPVRLPSLQGPVAQRSEQRTHNPSRGGSNPPGPKNKVAGNGDFILGRTRPRFARRVPEDVHHRLREDRVRPGEG